MTAQQHAAKCAECIDMLMALDSPPVTLRERLEHRRLVTAEVARAEARRAAPSPQMRLGE